MTTPTAKALRTMHADLHHLDERTVRDAIRTQRNAADEVVTRAERAGRDLLASEQRAYSAAVAEIAELDQLLDDAAAARGRAYRSQLDERSRLAADVADSRRRAGVPLDLGGERSTASLGQWLVRALAGGSGSGAPFAPTQQSSEVFQYLAANTVHGQMGVRIITTGQRAISFPNMTAGASVGWYAEGGTISATDPTASSLTATPKKIAGLTVVSNELIADSDPAILDAVAQDLVAQIGRKLDLGVFEGAGSSNEPTGLKNVSGINEVSMGNNGAAPTDLSKIADAIYELQADNANPTALVMHPRTLNTFRKLLDGANRPLLVPTTDPGAGVAATMFGVPVYVSSQLSITETQGTSTDCSSVYLVEAPRIVVVMRSDATVELGRERLFNSDQSEIRVTMRADVLAPQPTAICRIKGVRA